MTFVLSPPGQHGLLLLTPGYLMFFVNIGPDSERQRENGENQNDPSDPSMYQSLLSSFSVEVHTAKSSHFHNKINSAPDMRNLFRTFNYLLCPPSPPPTTSITADDFATFFTDKTKTISSQFSPPLTQDPKPTRSTAQTPIFSFCPFTEAEVSKLLLSSHPTTCSLDPIPSHLLQAISPTLLPALTHIIYTSLVTGIFPTAFKQAWVTPLLIKPTLNTSLIENYRPVSLLPFISKTLEWVVFNQVSLFISQNNKLDAKQSGFRSGHSTETALLSVTEALRIAKADSKSSVLILLDLSAAFDTVNHQILLSTVSSLDITGIQLCWFESYLTGLSGWPGEGRYPKHINWSLGFPRDWFLDPSSSPHTLHHWVPSYRHMASPTISMLMTHNSISHFDQMIQR